MGLQTGAAMGGQVVAPAPCTGQASVLDFFVISQVLAPCVDEVTARVGICTRPHCLVELRLKGIQRAAITKLVQPRAFPKYDDDFVVDSAQLPMEPWSWAAGGQLVGPDGAGLAVDAAARI